MPRRRITIESVLDAAAEVVDTDGRDELSLGRLADDLGVQPSALYNHVDGIGGLRHDLAVHAMEHLASQLRDALVARSGDDALRSIAHAYRRFAHESPGQFASTVLPPADAVDSLSRVHADVIDLFVAVVRSLGVRGDQAVHQARLARSAIHGFVSLEAVEAMIRPVDRSVSFDQLVDSLLAGIQP